jgi:hypothetical protein
VEHYALVSSGKVDGKADFMQMMRYKQRIREIVIEDQPAKTQSFWQQLKVFVMIEDEGKIVEPHRWATTIKLLEVELIQLNSFEDWLSDMSVRIDRMKHGIPKEQRGKSLMSTYAKQLKGTK